LPRICRSIDDFNHFNNSRSTSIYYYTSILHELKPTPCFVSSTILSRILSYRPTGVARSSLAPRFHLCELSRRSYAQIMAPTTQHYNWHVRALTVPGPDSDLSLFVSFDNVRYLFGCGEGTQRAFVQKRFSTRGLAGVFLPDGGSKGRAGLPGASGCTENFPHRRSS